MVVLCSVSTILTFTVPPEDFVFGEYSLIILYAFFINPTVKRTIVAFPFHT